MKKQMNYAMNPNIRVEDSNTYWHALKIIYVNNSFNFIKRPLMQEGLFKKKNTYIFHIQ